MELRKWFWCHDTNLTTSSNIEVVPYTNRVLITLLHGICNKESGLGRTKHSSRVHLQPPSNMELLFGCSGVDTDIPICHTHETLPCSYLPLDKPIHLKHRGFAYR